MEPKPINLGEYLKSLPSVEICCGIVGLGQRYGRIKEEDVPATLLGLEKLPREQLHNLALRMITFTSRYCGDLKEREYQETPL